jgi:tetratricopeptide (TPR) repeat protein/DNA-binding CsgD family transcriptional regulator
MLKEKAYYLLNFAPVLLLLLLCFCSKQKRQDESALHKAENIIEQHPDSALHLLNTVLFPEDLNKALFNKYNLLLLQAKDKNDRDITGDTIIFSVKDWYVQKKDFENAALAAFYCGRVRHEKNDADRAIEAYQEAGKWADKTENYNLKGLIFGNLGILHSEYSLYEKAIELSKSAVEMYDKAKNCRNKISALGLIGDCFALNKKIDSSFYYYNEGLKLADSCNIPELQSNVKQSMAVAYREQGFYEEAKKLFREALAFFNDSEEQAIILLNIAQTYVYEDNPDSLDFYLNKALALQIDDPWLMQVSYYLKSQAAEKHNNYREALEHHKEFYHSTMNVFNSEKSNKLLEIQEKYDFEKLRSSKKELELKHQEVLTLFFLSLLLTGAIVFIYYRKSAENKRLLLETEQRIAGLQKMADDFSGEKRDFHHILLEQFGVLRKTALIETVLSEPEQASGRKLLKKFNEIVYGRDTLDWNKLYQSMNNLRDGLYGQIRGKYPQLSEMEFRICCLSCETDFSDKEIMIVLGTTLNMVRRIRSDLRKKIGMSKGENFRVFFEKNLSLTGNFHLATDEKVD